MVIEFKTNIICVNKTELISSQIDMSSELIQYPKYILEKAAVLFNSLSRPVQPDVVKKHLTRAAGNRHVTFGTKTNSDTVNIC